MQACRWS